MLLDQILNPRNNNFDIFRLLAAMLVIYGHAPAFVSSPGPADIVYRLVNFDYSGSLAVKFFFMLSGLLVTVSLMNRPFLGEFIIKRAARIFPGLIVCVTVTVLVIGPLFTGMGVRNYFFHPETWSYLVNNSLLYQLRWDLPGVFTNNNAAVNGSLWTLPLEVVCYLFLAVFYVVGAWRHYLLGTVLLVCVVCISFFFPQYLPPIFSGSEAHQLPGCFALGALMATYRHQLLVNFEKVAALWILYLLLSNTPLKALVFYVVLFYSFLFFSSIKIVVEKLKIPADPSYGVYIYGFVVQQMVAHIFPAQGVIFNQVVSGVIALLIGLLSWFYIEKPALLYTKKYFNIKNFSLLTNKK